MATTSGDNLYSPDSIDQVDGIVADLAAMQGSTQAALDYRKMRSYKPADATALAAITGMSAGDLAYQQDTGAIYLRGVSAWNPFSSDSGWITPTLAAGWATPAGNFVPLQYRKIGNEVIFRGAATGATSGDPIFTLPAGYLPPIAAGKELYMAVLNGTSTTATTRVVIRANGTVVAVSSTTPNFDLVNFRTN